MQWALQNQPHHTYKDTQKKDWKENRGSLASYGCGGAWRQKWECLNHRGVDKGCTVSLIGRGASGAYAPGPDDEEEEGDENLRATIPQADYGRSKTTGECEIFQIFGWHDAWCTREIKSMIAMAEAGFSKKNIVKCCIWNMALYGVETWILQKVGQKYMENLEMWCWRIEKISWTDHVRNEEVLHRGNEDRNILQTRNEGRLTGLVTSCVGTAL